MQADLTSPGQLDVAGAGVDVAFRVEQTRVLGLLYLSGSLLVAISLAFPWWPDAHRAAIWTIIALGTVTGAGLLTTAARRRPLVSSVLGGLLALGSTLVGAGTYFAGQGGSAVIAVFYVYAAAYAFYYLPPAWAVVQTLYAAATYAVALALSGVPTGTAQWIIMIGGAVVAGSLIGGSGSRARQSLDTEHALAEQLREADRMKTAFLRAVSHDLRTPVASLVGFAELLQTHDGQLGRDDQQDISVRLVRNARKVAQIVDDLLQLDELNTGRVTPNLVPTDLSALVRQVVAAADLPDVPITVDAEPIVVLVDAAKIRRALDNLLTNAARYTPQGTPVRVAVRPDDRGGAVITVEDRGPGVHDDDKAVIFEPFERGTHIRDPEVTGSGLGLSLVRQFARLHGGDAWVDDRPGGGARFHISVPATADQPQGPHPSTQRRRAPRVGRVRSD